MERKDIKYSKYCLVPQCQSTSIKTPDKLFVSLPVGSSSELRRKRKLWLRAMKRNGTDISESTRGFVCEDHFNLEKDMKNYMKFKLMGGNVYFKDHVVPHIFECQAKKRRSLSFDHSSSTKKSRDALVNVLLNETAENKHEQQTESQFESSNTSEIPVQVLNEDLLNSNVIDKCTQTVSIDQRTVSVQYRTPHRSKFVQTDIVIVRNSEGNNTHSINSDCSSSSVENNAFINEFKNTAVQRSLYLDVRKSRIT